MTDAAADPKAAPLADDLRDFALTLRSVPKNFSCAICNNVAIDAYKLLCCNKPICSYCQEKFTFPTTCPLCEHDPLEAESCIVNKVLRNTIRIWLAKQQKKKEEKLASEVPTPTVETTPVVETTPAAEVVATVEKPEEGESAPAVDGNPAAETTPAGADKVGDSDADAPVNATSNSIEAGDGAETSEEAPPRAASSASQPGEDPNTDDQGERNASVDAADGAQSAQDMDEQGNAMYNNNPNMFPNGMPGQFGNYGPGQSAAGFANGMPFNGMNAMNGMSNMMGSYMNPMGYGMNNSNGMYGNYGGGMGMGMNNMGAMNYGGGYGNGWSGMGGANYGGYNNMGGHNQSFPGMMNQFPNKSNFANQNRYNPNGPPFPQQRANRNGSFGGGFGPGNGYNANTANSRPGTGNGPHNNHVRRFPKHVSHRLPKRPDTFVDSSPPPPTKTDQCDPIQRDGQSPAGSADATVETRTEKEHTAEASVEGKDDAQTTTDEGADGEKAQGADPLTETAGTEAPASNTLNQIQTVDTNDDDSQNFDYGMQPGMGYGPHMMDQYPQQQPYTNGAYQPQYNQNFGHRGDHNAAYGSSTVVVGEPRGLGVAGAPTGPRAMREKNNFKGPHNPRFNSQAPRTAPTQPSTSGSPPRESRASPVRDDSLRTKEKSPSRSRSRSRGRNETRDDHGERSRSGDDQRERTPVDNDHDHHEERRRRRSSRNDDERDDYEDRRRDDRESRGHRTRSTSRDSKHRSRREEKHRSSRPYRDRSREHRRRQRSYSRSRSHSPIAGEKYEDGPEETNSRRRNKGDKDKYRDRSRDRDRERDRRDRKERDYDDDKYRSRDKDRERRRRRDREADDEDRVHDDDKHDKHRSRRSRKDRDRERDYDRDYEKPPKSATSTRPASPPLNAPAGPSADRFSFRGASSKTKTMPPPAGPRGMQPPKGPSGNRESRGKTNSVTLVPSTPTDTAVPDHYAAEREKNARERAGLDRDPYSSNKNSSNKTLQSRASSSRTSLSKRSRDEAEEKGNDAPTAPSSHRDKRRKSRDAGGNGGQLANLFTKGLRKSAGKRGGVKTEGEVERELERTERERDRRY
ncbi:hypothetical protein P280DRAFT_523750 [Massarina eburnea CBS 473.64]|uniref:RING-type domain-containing protein n=1 Tax=Massarina eburnea CBS 473.64 TaxID=1395130 RepID=A0A6A6RHQ6_9PLEO|nr:hypothetical protein P280DRAFT_523750 [Massarina eburnea CBS 473.64]